MSFKFFSKDEGHLARTRKEQFGYIIRNNVSTLFISNVIAFVFTIPLIIVFILFSINFHQLSITEGSTTNQFISVFMITGGLTFVSTIVFNLGLIGQYTVIKELVLNSTSKLSSFFKGIKSNFKDTIFPNILYSIVFALLVINVGTYLYVQLSAPFKLVILIINISLCFLLLLGKGYINFEMVVFKNKTLVYIRNGVYLFYKNLPLSLVELILILIPFIAIGFVPINFVFIPVGLLATCYISLASLANFIIAISCYEKLFSKEEIPAIYHKGLEDINL